MKQCPSCNRTYTNDRQKFCTQDGTSLVDARVADVAEGETIRIDSEQLDAEITKVISQELPRMSGSTFDPYKTVVSTPQSTTPAAPTSPPIVNPPTATPLAEAASPTMPPTTTSAPVPPSAVASPSAPLSAAPPGTGTPATVPPPAAMPPPATPPAAQSAAAPPAATTPPPPASQEVAAQAAQASSSAVGEAGQVTLPPPSAQTAPASSSALGEAGQVTLPPPSVQAAAAAAAQPVQPRKKKSKLPLILGILFVLLLLGAGGAVAGYFFLLKPILEKKHIAVLEPRRPQPTPIVERTPDVRNTKTDTPSLEVPPYSPPANAVEFVNSSAKLSDKLAEHYVDFSFYYPKSWQRDPKAGVPGATNFVQVERRLPPNYTLENFAVGWYSSAGSAEADRTTFPRLVASLSGKFEKTIDNYRKVSEHETKVGPYDAHEFRFEGLSQPTDKGQFKIWGVAIFVPPVNGGNDGVTLLMLATSLAPELKSINDVGVKGELPMVLESFRFGK